MTKFAAALAAAKATGPTGAQKSSTVPELSGWGSGGIPSWGSMILPPDRELADAWRGHQRTLTVEAMLNDSQVASLRQVVRLPVHSYVIELDPRDCPPAAAQKLADDLDVPLTGGEERDDLADDFSARRHLDRAMDALDYGHAVFEQEGRVDDDGWWRLVDLPPVPQWTIDQENSWEIDRFGHVLQVVQWGANPPVKLPVDHLVTFTWQGRPGDPRGRSLLRPLYGSWLLRDRTMRVMGMSAERTGMGIPIGRVPVGSPPEAKAKMEGLLAGMAAGHDSNLVLETDDDLRGMVGLMGVSGSTPDLVGMLRYHDEAMARAMLAMLVQLGQTQTGSRALGGTFDDILALFRDTIVRWYCDTMNKQLVARWVERNPVDGSPRLVWRRREDTPPVAAIATPVVAPATIDGTATEIPAPAQLPVAASQGQKSDTRSDTAALARRQRATRAAFATVAGRDLRRDPSPVELAAAVDFATVEAQFVATRANVATALLAVRDQLTAVAVQEVAAMPEVDPLTLGDTLGVVLEQHAADMDTAPLIALLVAFAAAGVNQVIGEAARQGVELAATIDYQERAAADAADLVRRMARQVAESAAAAARTGVPAGLSGGPASDVISEHLGTLTAAAAEQAAAGASSRAQNAGRAAAISAGPQSEIFSSEVLDQSTCQWCLLIDGHQYASLDAALLDYPAGGFSRCEGFERCRGILIAVFDTSAAVA